MSETESPREAYSPVHAHEKTDADVRNLMWFGLAVAGLVIFGFIVAEVAFRVYVGEPERTGKPCWSNKVIAWRMGMRTIPALRSTQP